ncbi:MAG: hypothetical protein AB1641_23120 [Thermodesulfobacteriota bacterium]
MNLPRSGEVIRSLKGKAIGEKGRDQTFRTRRPRLGLELEVDLDDTRVPILEQGQDLMEKGDPVTYSLENAIEIEHVIRRVGES